MVTEQRKQILTETINRFKAQQWFRGAVVHDAYPTTGEPTLEFRVNFVPLFERKTIKEWVLKYNLTERFTIIDKDGNPAS